jgi:hypothetical protein
VVHVPRSLKDPAGGDDRGLHLQNACLLHEEFPLLFSTFCF